MGFFSATSPPSVILPEVSGMRLSAITGNAAPSADVSGATLYLVPFKSGDIWVPDSGGTWVLRSNTAELSLSLAGTGASVYDVFVWDNAGTLTLKLSTAWTNDTTRANALTTLNGVKVNGSTEGSMPASRGLHLGRIRASTAFLYDSRASRHLANTFNALPRPIFQCPNYSDNNATTSYTAPSRTTWGQLDSGQITFVSDGVSAYDITLALQASATANFGISEDSSTTPAVTTQSRDLFLRRTNVLAEGWHTIRMMYTFSSTFTVYADAARAGATADPPRTFFQGVMYG